MLKTLDFGHWLESKIHRIAIRTCLSVQFSFPSFILVRFCQFLFSTSCQVSCPGDYMLHPNVLHLCLIFLSVPRAFELCFPSEPHHRHDCVIAPVSFPRVIFVNFCLIFGTLPWLPGHLRAEHPPESHTELLLPLPVLPAQIPPLCCSPASFFLLTGPFQAKIRIARELRRGMLLTPTPA